MKRAGDMANVINPIIEIALMALTEHINQLVTDRGYREINQNLQLGEQHEKTTEEEQS